MRSMTLLNNYVPKLEWGVDKPICAKYNVLVESGRTSCGEPNMQNPPKYGGVRECFIPRKNYLFASADYDTIELRALAQCCLEIVGFSHMAVAFKQGADPHLNLAAELMGIDPAEAAKLRAQGNDQVEHMRQLAKVANFGFPGGLAADSFVEYAKGYDLSIDRGEAHRIQKSWLRTWPEMNGFFQHVHTVVGPINDGEVIQPMSLRKRGGLDFCAACNTYFQGRTADGAKDAHRRLARECYVEPASPLYGSRPVIFMHDEFILEVPENKAHEAAARLAVVMRERMQWWMPDVPVTCAPVLMRRWYKGAKPVFVDGKLRPSRPVREGDGKTTWAVDE